MSNLKPIIHFSGTQNGFQGFSVFPRAIVKIYNPLWNMGQTTHLNTRYKNYRTWPYRLPPKTISSEKFIIKKHEGHCKTIRYIYYASSLIALLWKYLYNFFYNYIKCICLHFVLSNKSPMSIWKRKKLLTMISLQMSVPGTRCSWCFMNNVNDQYVYYKYYNNNVWTVMPYFAITSDTAV